MLGVAAGCRCRMLLQGAAVSDGDFMSAVATKRRALSISFAIWGPCWRKEIYLFIISSFLYFIFLRCMYLFIFLFIFKFSYSPNSEQNVFLLKI